MNQQNDNDPQETQEWLDALNSVIDAEGIERAHYLIEQLNNSAIRTGKFVPITSVTTPYCNTIAPQNEERMPGDMFMERQIRGIIRWNAMAMVMRANMRDPSIGGHISTFASSATLYDVASTISSVAQATRTKAISSIIRATRRRVFILALSSKGASAKNSSIASVRKSEAMASHPIRIPG